MKKAFIIFGVLTSLHLKAEINLGPCDVPVATALMDFSDHRTPINADKQNFRVIKGKIIYKNATPLISKETSDNKQVYVYKDGQGIRRRIEISNVNDEIIIQKTDNAQESDKIIDARSGKETSISEQVFPSIQRHSYYKFKIKDNKCSFDQFGEKIMRGKAPPTATVIYDTKYCVQTNTLRSEHCANKILCPDIFFTKLKEIYNKRNLEIQKDSQTLDAGPPEPAVRLYIMCSSKSWQLMGFDKFMDPILADDINDGKIQMPNYNTPKKGTL